MKSTMDSLHTSRLAQKPDFNQYVVKRKLILGSIDLLTLIFFFHSFKFVLQYFTNPALSFTQVKKAIYRVLNKRSGPWYFYQICFYLHFFRTFRYCRIWRLYLPSEICETSLKSKFLLKINVYLAGLLLTISLMLWMLCLSCQRKNLKAEDIPKMKDICRVTLMQKHVLIFSSLHVIS